MAGFRPPGFCPVCHEHVVARIRACPNCGSSADDGWGEGAGADGLDLPDDEFDYDEFVAREFGGGSASSRGTRRDGSKVLWTLVAIGLAAVFAGAGWFALH